MISTARQQLFVIAVLLALLALPSRAAAHAEAVTSTLPSTPSIDTCLPALAAKPPPAWLPALVESRTPTWLPALAGRSQILMMERTSILQDVRRRDSLANGIVIGAAVGAAAMGTFGAILCKVTQEPSGPSCVGDTFRFAAIGGAIGAGGGLVVDAALDRQSGVRVAVGIKF